MSSASGGVSQRLLSQLGYAIVQGDYAEAGRLPTEQTLCQLFKVSRSAVREAISVLSSKGLVHSKRRQGTAVNHPDLWNLLDPDVLNWIRKLEYTHNLLNQLVQVRIAVEPEAAAIVADRRVYVDFTAMATNLAILENTKANKAALQEADINFHMSILESTGNRFYRQMKTLVTTSLNFGYEFLELYDTLAPNQGENAKNHRDLMEMMLDGNADEARKHSREMILKVKSVVERLCEKEKDDENMERINTK